MWSVQNLVTIMILVAATMVMVCDLARRVGTMLIDHYFQRRRELAKEYAATLQIGEPEKGEG